MDNELMSRTNELSDVKGMSNIGSTDPADHDDDDPIDCQGEN